MSSLYDDDQLADIATELLALPRETPWIEFKENNEDPQLIGEYLSGLSNSAALEGKPRGFLLWGVSDAEHRPLGTGFDPTSAKKGNEDLIPWLTRGLTPQLHFEFDEVEVDGARLVLMSVEAASFQPTKFFGEERIRLGSYLKDLRNLPDYERRLWASFQGTPFEKRAARDRVGDADVLEFLDFKAFFELLDSPVPGSRNEILSALRDEGLIQRGAGSGWTITNLGAILLANNLAGFPTVARKSVRVVTYDGRNKAAPAVEQTGEHGYASGFRAMIRYINGRVPTREIFVDGVRQEEPVFPAKAIRELVVNALVHQDLGATGSGPLIEIFPDRLEVTNPGEPLVDISRLIDAAPRSRNEAMASLMRRMGLCEERGSGWDQIVSLVEVNELPAPLIQVGESYMRVTLFAYRPLANYSREERVRAVYFHASLLFVAHERATNTTVRKRFGIAEKNSAVASRLLKDSVDANLIVPYDASVGARAMSYIPIWAK